MIYDDMFDVKKTRMGLYTSYKLDGTEMITALTEEACVYSTRYNLKAEIDDTLWGDNVQVIGKATVEGKL